MFPLALKMLCRNPLRLVMTLAAVAALFFLSASTVGVLVGWCNTTSAIIQHSQTQLWVVAKGTTALDYGVPMSYSRVHRVRSVPGVEWAEGLIVDFVIWQSETGRRVSIEMVGLDQSHVGGPWDMEAGEVDDVQLPDSVIVDGAYLDQLGVEHLGGLTEINGERVVVRGICRGVRTFTASPVVFASMKSARKYLKRYSDDDVTYVLVQCTSAAAGDEVRARILAQVPHVEVLTRGEFARRTIAYWMLRTGAGLTVVLIAALGFCVSSLVVSQTLYTITLGHLDHYATLLALGFSRLQLTTVVVIQALFLGASGILGGTWLMMVVVDASLNTPIPVQVHVLVHFILCALHLAVCLLAGFLPVRSIFRMDPVLVFRA